MNFRLTLLLTLSFQVATFAGPRTWRDFNVRTIEAEVTGMDSASRAVKARLADGRDIAIRTASLIFYRYGR